MNAFGWDDLRAVLAKVAPDSEPVIDQIDFDYEEITTRDGSGVVRTSYLTPIGATVRIRIG